MISNENQRSSGKVLAVTISSQGITAEENKPEDNELGQAERNLICTLTGNMPPLPYPTHLEKGSNGEIFEVYDIPDNQRQAVFDQLYFLEPKPNLTDTLMDIHENTSFVIKDYLVIRADDTNYLVSPYFLHSGGTMLDWFPMEQPAPESFCQRITLSDIHLNTSENDDDTDDDSLTDDCDDNGNDR